jgi:xanthine dehydrogenase accessory factor
MSSIDQQVLTQLHDWLQQGQNCWLCTILKTVGSSPRPVGSLLACNAKGQTVGSLSGGCVEEDLIDKLLSGRIAQLAPERVEYGISAEENERFGLPCGGRMHILIEPVKPDQLAILAAINRSLADRQCCERQVDLATGKASVSVVEKFSPLQYDATSLRQTFGPRYLLLLVGAGQLANCLAQVAMMMDFRIVVCDPRPEKIAEWPLEGVELIQGMPDDVVRDLVRDSHSIVITLTHDPRIDDMALMEALKTPALYVGALGSKRTSEKRRERLQQLDLTARQIEKLHAPVGLSIGSKTPPEIAVAILAELTQVLRQG